MLLLIERQCHSITGYLIENALSLTDVLLKIFAGWIFVD